MPSVALREIDALPMGLLEAIVLYRGYRDTKAALERARAAKEEHVDDHPAYRLVVDIEFELVRERRRRQREGLSETDE